MLKPVKGKAHGDAADASASASSGGTGTKPVDKMTVKELKDMLIKAGKSTQGNKAALIDRAKALK